VGYEKSVGPNSFVTAVLAGKSDWLKLYGQTFLGMHPAISDSIRTTESSAALAVSSWMRDGLLKSREEKDEYGQFDSKLDASLSKEQISRLKYRFKANDELKPLFKHMEQWLCWSLYLKLVDEEVADELKYWLALSNGADFDRLKNLGTIAKKFGPQFSKNWEYFVDLHLLGDYKLEPSPEDIIKETEDWVTGSLTHKLSGFDFYALFARGCDTFLRTSIKTPIKRALTVDEFLSDPMYWATPGSSNGERLRFTTTFERGKRAAKARKSKWATAMAVSKGYLLSTFYDTRKQVLTTAPKRELGKARMIIAGDLSNYLRMSYISYWLEDILRNHPNTTLFYDTDQLTTMWTQMIQGCGSDHRNKGVNTPIDESKYDHYIDQLMIQAMLISIRNLIFDYAPADVRPSMLLAMDLIIDSITDMRSPGCGIVTVRLRDGSLRTIYISKGLLSGWRWTALLDTIANAAKIHAFRYVTCARAGSFSYEMDPVMDFTSQGDDVRSRLRSYYHAQLFLSLYEEAGFEVNAAKFFVSPERDEFLRKFATSEQLSGYPARGVATLIFRNPKTKATPVGQLRLSELASNWMMVGRRCKTRLDVLERYMVNDLARANMLDKETIKVYLHAFANNGGFGLQPVNDARIEHIHGSKIALVEIKTPELLLKYPDRFRTIIKDQWIKGVDFGDKAKYKFTSYKLVIHKDSELSNGFLKEIAPRLTSLKKSPITKCSLFSGPRAKVELDPSLVWAYKFEALRMKRSDLLLQSASWMDEVSIVTLSQLLAKCSMYVVREWLDGNMLGSPPKVYEQGDIVVPSIYKNAAANTIMQVFNNSKVSGKLLNQARLTAEMATYRYALNLKFKYAD